jgi:hypothetical protein
MWRAAAMAVTAASSEAMSSCVRTPATDAATLRETLATISSALSSMLTRRCSGEPPSASVRERELEFAQAGEAEVAAGAHPWAPNCGPAAQAAQSSRQARGRGPRAPGRGSRAAPPAPCREPPRPSAADRFAWGGSSA